jgi:hypothetical protein
MQRHINVSLALILGLAATLNTTPLFAQDVIGCNEAEEISGFDLDCESVFAEGLKITSTLEAGLPYRYYDVQFNDELNGAGAYIPERFNPEAMVVKVLNGAFAFRVQGPGVIVDTQNRPLEKVTATPPIPLGGNPDEAGVDPNDSGIRRTYDPAAGDDFTCNVNLPDGRTVCLLDPVDFQQGDTFVRLERDDTVYLPANSTCFLCNTDRIDPTTGQVDPNGSVPAELLIWSSTTGFNGDLQDAASASETSATPTMQGSGSAVGWMFNPGGRCN